MLNRAEQVLNRLSHHKAAEIGSLTGRMVAVENSPTIANMNRVYCQAGLLYQQERRLDDVHLGSYIKRMMENRLNDDPEDEPSESAMVHRQLSLVAYQSLVRLQTLKASISSCRVIANEIEDKKAHLSKLLATLEAVQTRHEELVKCDTLAGEIHITFPSVKQLEEDISVVDRTLESKRERLQKASGVSEAIQLEAAELVSKVTVSVSRLNDLLEELNATKVMSAP